MAAYGPKDMRLQRWARLLFEQWRKAKRDGRDWNKALLIVVAIEDQRAWIEYGPHWASEQDRIRYEILEQRMVPYFEAGDFDEGLFRGVLALYAMVRGEELPGAESSWTLWIVIGSGVVVVLLSAVSLWRSGRAGWAWTLWGLTFRLPGLLLYRLIRAPARAQQPDVVGATGSYRDAGRRADRAAEAEAVAEAEPAPDPVGEVTSASEETTVGAEDEAEAERREPLPSEPESQEASPEAEGGEDDDELIAESSPAEDRSDEPDADTDESPERSS